MQVYRSYDNLDKTIDDILEAINGLLDADNISDFTTSSPDAIVIEHGGNIALKYGGDIRFSSITAPIACVATLAGVAGVVDAGTHKYKITYVNDYGETELGAVSNTVTTVAGNQQVNLTSIATTSNGDVTSRKVYRTAAGGSGYSLLTTINDNVTTTYTDNTADSGLGASGTARENTTFGKVIIDGDARLYLTENNIKIGTNALVSNVEGINNVAVGHGAMHDAIYSDYNVAIGESAMYSLVTGFGNVAIGRESMLNTVTGYGNTAVGERSLFGGGSNSSDYNCVFGYRAAWSLDGGDNNILMGNGVATALTTGSQNTIIGDNAGDTISTHSGNVLIGYAAGANLAASNRLYIENSNSSSPLVYGEFDNNILRINGEFQITGRYDGWIGITGTFTYASAITINVSSGAASIYNVGDKIRFQNNDSGTYIYVYIVGVADTLLTIFGGTVPNATLTDAYYSKIENPLGFPHWIAWSPSLTGFSVAPSNDVYYFKVIGTMCTLAMRQATAGTSSTAGFTISLPITAATVTNLGWEAAMVVMDNGANLTTPGLGLIASGATTLSLYKDFSTAGWTSSGNKRLTYGNITYQIAS